MPPRRPLDLTQRFSGVNRTDDQQALAVSEIYQGENLYPKTQGIAEMRPGAARWNAAAWPGATRGRAITRFYPSGLTAQKVAALNVDSADVLVRGNDTDSTLAEITGTTALGTNKQWLFAKYQGALYMGNGTQIIQKTTAGLTRADIAGSPQMPIGYPAGPYRFRLLSFGNPAALNELAYTLVGAEAQDSPGVRTVESPEPITAARVFGRDENRGIYGDLAVFTGTSIWTQRDDFEASAGAWDLMTEHLGTLSPHTLVNTPLGLMGLGYDATEDFVCFIIPLGATRPVLISGPIRSMEALPLAYRQYACAEYYKDFYIVSFVPEGETTPTRQWWADMRRFSLDSKSKNYGIGWWGPMSGQCIGGFAIQSDVPDANELLGVDGAAGYINSLWQEGTYADYGTSWTAQFETRSMDSKDPASMKIYRGALLGVRAAQSETITVRFKSNEGETAQQDAIAVGGGGTVVGDTTLVGDSTYVGGETFGEAYLSTDTPLFGNRLAVNIEYSGGRFLALKRVIPIGVKTPRIIA